MGFEPTLPCGKHAFQAGAFNHSATSPSKLEFLVDSNNYHLFFWRASKGALSWKKNASV
jgi:hypothetical protein